MTLMSERLEVIVKPEEGHHYEDHRGSIDYTRYRMGVDEIGIITCKKGSMRSNHYHPQQTQVLFVASGKYISISQDISDPNNPIRSQIANTGDLIVTPPMVAHATLFVEDTVLIHLVDGDRDPKNYNKNTIPFPLVSSDNAREIFESYKRGTYEADRR